MMRSSIFLMILVSLLVLACNNAPKEERSAADTTTAANADVPTTTDEVRTNMSYLNDFNALEKVFGNENWLIPGEKDSSYFYMSRMGDYVVNTYSYKLVKGDSAQVKRSKMEMDGKTINWEFDNRQLSITGATSTRIVAAIVGT